MSINRAADTADRQFLTIVGSGSGGITAAVFQLSTDRIFLKSGHRHDSESYWADSVVRNIDQTHIELKCFFGYWGSGTRASSQESRRYFDFPKFFAWESSVSHEERRSDQVRANIYSVMTTSDYADFDDGIISDLSESVSNSLNAHPDVAIEAIATLIPRSKPEIAEQVLRLIGESGGSNAQEQKFEVLAKALNSEIPIVRDGAIIGLVELNDSRGAQALKDRLEKEENSLLQKNIGRAIMLIEDSQS